MNFVSLYEPKKIDEALPDPFWVTATKEELTEVERNKVWKLVPRPSDKTVIGTEWVFRNKLDENGTVTRNKARLITPVARLKAIRLFLALPIRILKSSKWMSKVPS